MRQNHIQSKLQTLILLDPGLDASEDFDEVQNRLLDDAADALAVADMDSFVQLASVSLSLLRQNKGSVSDATTSSNNPNNSNNLATLASLVRLNIGHKRVLNTN